MKLLNLETNETFEISLTGIFTDFVNSIFVMSWLFCCDDESALKVSQETFCCLIEQIAKHTNKEPDDVFNTLKDELKAEEDDDDE